MLFIGSKTWIDLKIPYQVSKEIHVFLPLVSQSLAITKVCANPVAIFLEICLLFVKEPKLFFQKIYFCIKGEMKTLFLLHSSYIENG